MKLFDLQRFADGDTTPETGDTHDTDEGTVVPEETVPKAQYDALQRDLEELRQRHEQLLQTLTNPAYLQSLQGSGYQPQQYTNQVTQAAAPDPEEEEEPDWDRMTPKEFAKRVAAQVEKQILSKIEPRLQHVAQSSEEIRILREIDAVRAKYPDFEQVRPLMQRVAQEMESQGVDTSKIGVERLYHMVKGQQVGRSGGAVATPARAVTRPRPQPASEKPGVAPNAANRGTLTPQEAFEEAWRRAGLDKIFAA